MVTWIKKVSRNYKLLMFIFCTFLGFIYYFFFRDSVRFVNFALYDGDIIHYQTLAVNLLYGNGYKYGVFGDIEEYSFYKVEKDNVIKNNFTFEYNPTGIENVDFYRTPGYPFFIFLIYKIWGVDPAIIKRFQLLLLCLVAGFFPFLNYLNYKSIGFYLGLISGFLVLHKYSSLFPLKLWAESVVVFMLFITLYTITLYTNNPKNITAIASGIFAGLCVLVKPNTIFIPVLVFLYLLLTIRKRYSNYIHLLIYSLCVSLVIVPWILYASVKSGHFVFLSSQGEYALLESNSEYSLDGKWRRKGYRTDEAVFYNSPDVKNKSTLGKFFNFLIEYRKDIPRMLLNKIVRAYKGYPFIILTFVAIVLRAALKFLFSIDIFIPVYVYIVFLNYFLIVVIIYGDPRYMQVLDIFCINFILSIYFYYFEKYFLCKNLTE